jgi:drug/metabolite transporter (DMT)-like permease
MRAAGLARVGLLALIWGSGFLWIKLSLRGFSPVQLTFARLALGAIVLVLLLWRARLALPADRSLWLHLIVAALLGNAIPYLLFGIAEQHVTSNLAGAINATTPLWTVALALATRTERTLTPVRLAGLVLGFAGGLVILAPWDARGSLGGAIGCLVASASYGASYVYIGRYITSRELPSLVLSAAQLIAASGLLLLAFPWGGFAVPEWRGDAVVSLAVLGVVGTGLAYILNYRIITDDGPILASTVTYLLPVVAVVLGWIVLGEQVTATMAAGVAVVLAGVAFTRSQTRNEAGPRPVPPERATTSEASRDG